MLQTLHVDFKTNWKNMKMEKEFMDKVFGLKKAKIEHLSEYKNYQSVTCHTNVLKFSSTDENNQSMKR